MSRNRFVVRGSIWLSMIIAATWFGQGVPKISAALALADETPAKTTKKVSGTIDGDGNLSLKVEAPTKEEDDPVADPSTRLFFLEFGTALLGPYSIVENTTNANQKVYEVKTGQRRVTGFIGANFRSRWAWNTPPADEAKSAATRSIAEKPYQFDWMPTFNSSVGKTEEGISQWFDLTFRADLGFGSTETTAATIVGSGDAFGEVTFGVPIYQFKNKSGLRNALNFDVHGAFATLTDFSNLNKDMGLGLTTALGIPIKNSPPIELSFGAGFSWVDTFDYNPSGTAVNVVLVDNLPEFRLREAFYVTAQLNIPLSPKGDYISLGGRFNDVRHSQYDAWSIMLSYSLSPAQLKEKLFGK